MNTYKMLLLLLKNHKISITVVLSYYNATYASILDRMHIVFFSIQDKTSSVKHNISM